VRATLSRLSGWRAIFVVVLCCGSFSVGGYTFEKFEKHRDSCYRCGDGGGSSGSGSAPAVDPREAERRNVLFQANYAWARHDYRTALDFAWKALAIRDDKGLREWARKLQASILADEGDALLEKGDLRGAWASYRRAIDVWPAVFDRADKPRLDQIERAAAELEKQDAERRKQATEREALIGAWRDANERARDHLQNGRWAEALATFDQVNRRMPEDSPQYWAIYNAVPTEVSVNRNIAVAEVARSRGDLSGAIENLQKALSWDASNALANRLLRAALDERQKTTAPMQSALRRTQDELGPNVVDARGPKPLADVIANIPELAESPAAERARKGLVAAANHDWKVALAWYQDALNHDPGNPVLKRAVDLAQWMVKVRPTSGPLPQSASMSAPISGSANEIAEKLIRAYMDMADHILAQRYDNDYDRAKADYFAHQLRAEATEARMFSEAMKQTQTEEPRKRETLPFKR